MPMPNEKAFYITHSTGRFSIYFVQTSDTTVRVELAMSGAKESVNWSCELGMERLAQTLYYAFVGRPAIVRE